MEEIASFSAEERLALFAQLAVPFDPFEVKWKVMRTANNNKRGLILPYADPRAYTDRLNQLFTPFGWTKSYSYTTLPGLTRIKDGKTIPTGKIILVSVVTIHSLCTHSNSGEEWADEENAVTSADAQAFKRACACFELGRYLYRFRETWVSLDRNREPVSEPELPQWALPPGVLAAPTNPRLGERANRNQSRGPIDHKLTSTIESFRRVLGDEIYSEILKRATHSRTARAIPNAELQKDAVQWLETAARGMERVHMLAEMAGEAQFIATMDELRIKSTATIPNLAMLKKLVQTLEDHTRTNVA